MAVDPVSLAINAALIAANVALTASQSFEGPRLSDLSVTTADYGAPLNYFYGVRRFDGVTCIWAEPLNEVKRRHKTKGGKFNEYTYYGTWAVAVADVEVSRYLKVLFDRNLIYDATGSGPISPFPELGDITQYMTFYYGADDQDVDPRMAASVDAIHGEGSTPAYRGLAYIVFKDVPLEKLGNRLPQVTVIAATAGEPSYPYDERDVVTTQPFHLQSFTYSPDGSRLLFGQDGDYEIWDVASRARMVSGTFALDTGLDNVISAHDAMGIGSDGSIYGLCDESGPTVALVKWGPDGLGAPTILASGVSGTGVQWFNTAPDGEPSVEFLCLPHSSDNLHIYDLSLAALTVTDSEDVFTDGLSPFCYVQDGERGVWAVGPRTGSGQTDLRFIKVVEGGAVGIWDSFEVTAPSATGVNTNDTYAVHFEDATHNQFVVSWRHTHLLAVDLTTRTVTATRALTQDQYNTTAQFMNLREGAVTIWLNEAEISLADLTTLRTVDQNDWVGAAAGDGIIYDPLNHALICAPGIFGDPLLVWRYLDRSDGSGVTLRSIVEDISDRSAVLSSDIDASDLTQTVTGYSWTQGAGKAILDPLLEAFDSEVRPHNFQLQFLRRGGVVLGTIPVADMGAGGTTRYEAPTVNETDLPLKVSVTFADIDSDQQPNTAIGQRSASAADSRRELSLDASTLALDPDDARPIADGYLRRAWMKAQTYDLSLTRAWSKLEPGDAYTLVLDDVSKSAKLTKLEFGANGVLTATWERYAPSIHAGSGLTGAAGDGLPSSQIAAFSYTKGVALDIPLVRDADDGLILYLAAGPYSPDVPWPGAAFWRSADGNCYDEQLGEIAGSQQATIGYALSVLPEALPEVMDRASTVSVKMFSGSLSGCTEAEALAGANLALIGNEIVNFTTATLVAENAYQLSGFLRGRRGTEAETATHATGEQFVLLSGLARAGMGASDVGDDIYVRPTTLGGLAGLPQLLDPYTGASLKPYSPAHLSVEDVSGDLVGTWVRRTRIGGTALNGTTPPLGETTEAYVGQVLDAGGSVIRTFAGLTSPTLTYTAAQQSADGSPIGVTLRVMQVSTVVGNGFPADVTI